MVLVITVLELTLMMVMMLRFGWLWVESMNEQWLTLDAAAADDDGDVLTASSRRLRVRTLHEQRDLCGWCPQL